MPPLTIVVIPCYNEELRLPTSEFTAWLSREAAAFNVKLLFVDDGSRDGTLKLLQRLCSAHSGRASLLALGTNQGKAEAVRRGLVQAIADGADTVGFWDSDLATPLYAVAQLAGVLHGNAQLQMIFAARVALLGRHIQRKIIRHYLGRVFATLASLTLDLAIYDTQCGAKLFRVSPELRAVVATPFLTRWVFDCEMIARYAALLASRRFPMAARRGSSFGGEEAARPPGAAGAASASFDEPGPNCLEGIIYEYPLDRWVDVAGSKVKSTDILRMAMGLVRIRIVYFLHEWPSGVRRPEFFTALVAVTLVALLGICAVVALALGLLSLLS